MTAAGTALDPRDWDPRDPAFRHDPIPWYRALREQAPVHYHPDVGYVVSRHADVDLVLRDERFGVAIVDASAAVGLSLPFLSLCLPRSWSRSTWLAASRRDAQP